MTDIVVFTKASCVQCVATNRYLTSRGLEFIELPAEDHLPLLRALNHISAPVVLADGEHWSGFRPDHIDRVIEARRSKDG